MTADATDLDIRYRGMLADYLEHPDEALLERAYALGREALASGRGVLDMATMHSQAMAAVLASSDSTIDRVRLSDALERFFVEAISPFEIAHRSFRDANLVLHRLNDVLENQAKRIAYSLHAEASQLVASVHLALADVATRLPPERVKEIQAVRGLLDQVEDRIRRISHELRPTILDDMGLFPAIELPVTRRPRTRRFRSVSRRISSRVRCVTTARAAIRRSSWRRPTAGAVSDSWRSGSGRRHSAARCV
jgi:signal transduction histidine kinase